MSVAIAAIYASLLAILYVVLSYRVVQGRLRFKVGLGTGQNAQLERAIRIHGNFAEYVPLAILLLAFYEAGGGAAWAVHVAGIWLVVARVLHAVGLAGSSGRSSGRFAGTAMTWALLLALSIGNLVLALRQP